MGTPIIDGNKLATELTTLLSKPEYKQILARENEDREMPQQKDQRRATLKGIPGKATAYQPSTPAQLAKEAVDAAFGLGQEIRRMAEFFIVAPPSSPALLLQYLHNCPCRVRARPSGQSGAGMRAAAAKIQLFDWRAVTRPV